MDHVWACAVFGINYLTALQETINADKDDKKAGGNSNQNYASKPAHQQELSSRLSGRY